MAETEMIPIARPWLGAAEIEACRRPIERGWVMQGEEVRAFEAAVAHLVGVEHAVACSSGTTALELAIVGLGIGPGDAVLVPSFSWIASANSVRACGAEAVLVDVDPATFNLTAATARAGLARCRARPKALMAVHQFGLCAPMDELRALADREGLVLIEDAACALGAAQDGRMAGAHSRAGTFSFHPRKVVTMGEGGVLVTGDAQLAARAAMLRNHGGWDPRRRPAGVEDYQVLGFNHRLTDVQAAIGRAQLDRLPAILQARRRWAARYDAAFADLAGLAIPHVPEGDSPVYQTYVTRLLEGGATRRDGILAELRRRGVGAAPGTMAIHQQPAYRGGAALPGATEAAARTIALPLYPQMTEAEHDRVVAAVRGALS